MALVDWTVEELLERIAAREPAPGGGSTAAVTGALAAALTEMTAGFGADSDARDRAHELRVSLSALADDDTRSYQSVLDALALPPSDPQRPERLQAALATASDVPLAIATAAAEVAELAAVASRTANVHTFGDAHAAATLAEGSARAAVRLVELNLAGSPDDPRVGEAAAAAQRASAASESVVAPEPD